MLSREERERIDIIKEVIGGVLFFTILIFLMVIGLLVL